MESKPAEDVVRKLDTTTTSSDLVQLNNLVVSLRPVVKKCKVDIVHKLVRQIRQIRKKKGTEEQLSANSKKADRLGEDILAVKKLPADLTAKKCLANTTPFSHFYKQESPESRALLRVACHSIMTKKVESWRVGRDDWQSLTAFLLYKNTGRRLKKPKLNRVQRERAKAAEMVKGKREVGTKEGEDGGTPGKDPVRKEKARMERREVGMKGSKGNGGKISSVDEEGGKVKKKKIDVEEDLRKMSDSDDIDDSDEIDVDEEEVDSGSEVDNEVGEVRMDSTVGSDLENESDDSEGSDSMGDHAAGVGISDSEEDSDSGVIVRETRHSVIRSKVNKETDKSDEDDKSEGNDSEEDSASDSASVIERETRHQMIRTKANSYNSEESDEDSNENEDSGQMESDCTETKDEHKTDRKTTLRDGSSDNDDSINSDSHNSELKIKNSNIQNNKKSTKLISLSEKGAKLRGNIKKVLPKTKSKQHGDSETVVTKFNMENLEDAEDLGFLFKTKTDSNKRKTVDSLKNDEKSKKKDSFFCNSDSGESDSEHQDEDLDLEDDVESGEQSSQNRFAHKSMFVGKLGGGGDGSKSWQASRYERSDRGGARGWDRGRGQGHDGSRGFHRGQSHNRGQGYDRGRGYNRGPGHDRGRGYNRGQGLVRGRGQERGQGYNRGQGHVRGQGHDRDQGYNRGRGSDRGRDYGTGRGFSGRGEFSRNSSGRGRDFVKSEQKTADSGQTNKRSAVQSADYVHPSWAASKRRKEQHAQLESFQGKKTTFDD